MPLVFRSAEAERIDVWNGQHKEIIVFDGFKVYPSESSVRTDVYMGTLFFFLPIPVILCLTAIQEFILV